MDTLTNLLESTKELVQEYNINSKANTMLYNDRDVANLFAEMYKVDRFHFVDRCNKICDELIPYVTPLHGKEVSVVDRDGKKYSGVIVHLPTREYEGRVLKHSVSMRLYTDGSEGIALWVDTGERFSSHLYTLESITFTN